MVANGFLDRLLELMKSDDQFWDLKKVCRPCHSWGKMLTNSHILICNASMQLLTLFGECIFAY